MFTRGYSGYPGCLHKKLGSHWAVDGKDLADFAILDLRGEGIGLSTVRSAQPSLPICCSFHKLFIYIYIYVVHNEQSAESCALTHYLILVQWRVRCASFFSEGVAGLTYGQQSRKATLCAVSGLTALPESFGLLEVLQGKRFSEGDSEWNSMRQYEWAVSSSCLAVSKAKLGNAGVSLSDNQLVSLPESFGQTGEVWRIGSFRLSKQIVWTCCHFTCTVLPTCQVSCNCCRSWTCQTTGDSPSFPGRESLIWWLGCLKGWSSCHAALESFNCLRSKNLSHCLQPTDDRCLNKPWKHGFLCMCSNADENDWLYLILWPATIDGWPWNKFTSPFPKSLSVWLRLDLANNNLSYVSALPGSVQANCACVYVPPQRVLNRWLTNEFQEVLRVIFRTSTGWTRIQKWSGHIFQSFESL